MPTFSISQVTTEQHEVTFREHDGYILHVPTGERFYFVKASCVYFMRMKVPNALVGNGGLDGMGKQLKMPTALFPFCESAPLSCNF